MSQSTLATLESSPAHKKIMKAIRAKGFRKFGNYLAARTVKPAGQTWSLSDMARELKINLAMFVTYHTRWVELKREGRV